MDRNELIRELITYFGGQKKTGEAIGVSQATVSGWLNGEHAVSGDTAFLIEEKTDGKFQARDLVKKRNGAAA